jgi:hypothetical protein
MHSVLLRKITGEDQPIPIDDMNQSVWSLKQRIDPSCSFTLVYNGKILSDSKPLLLYNLHDDSIVHMIYSLQGGGNDGGSIPTRGEMVKIKKKSKQSDLAISRRLRWITCALSKQPLMQPIVADQLGNIYNKEEIIKCLIEKNMPQRFNHIRTLKDVYEVNFIWNAKYDPSKPVQVSVDADISESPFQCPVTAQPANGQHPFSLILTCGHVLSEKGLQQIESQNLTCFVCQKYFTKSDIFPLNPSESSQEKLRNKMNLQRSNLDKKDNPLQSKLKRKLSSKNDFKAPTKRQRSKENNQGSVRNTLAVQAALEKVNSNHDAKKRTSEAYKSIFAPPATAGPSPTAFFTGTSRGVIK